jgi:hypothetical protein
MPKRLAPHESQDTDVILLGHSMGGLLSAEVLLLSPPPPPPNGRAFRHRLLGTINFDVPFLGMHPGVVSSGLASIFRPNPSPPTSPNPTQASESTASLTTTVNSGQSSDAPPPGRSDTLYAQPADPNFNPKFANDVNLPIRKGWKSTIHFINKHSDGLRNATKQYVKSHVEFGGAMADYRALHDRYSKIRSLDATDEMTRQKGLKRQGATCVPRVRFINYYTACNGRPKKPKDTQTLDASHPVRPGSSASHTSSLDISPFPSPRISVEEVGDDKVIPVPLREPPEPKPMQWMEPQAEEEADEDSDNLEPVETSTTSTSLDTDAVKRVLESSGLHVQLPMWPPLPMEPMEPSALDVSLYSDKLVQEALKKEHEKKVKAWKQAIKDREATISERKKVEDKIRKAAAKEALKKQKGTTEPGTPSSTKEGKLSSKSTRNETTVAPSTEVPCRKPVPPSAVAPPAPRSPSPPPALVKEKQVKKVKDRHFCVLPSKTEAGEMDPTWVKVWMEGMDEVAAHCGLFALGETYERLVGEVGAKVEEWVLRE